MTSMWMRWSLVLCGLLAGCAWVEPGPQSPVYPECNAANSYTGETSCYCTGCNGGNIGQFTECQADAITWPMAIQNESLARVGVVELKYSQTCGAVWAVTTMEQPTGVYPVDIAAFLYDSASSPAPFPDLNQPGHGQRQWVSKMQAAGGDEVACGWYKYVDPETQALRHDGICSTGGLIPHPPICTQAVADPPSMWVSDDGQDGTPGYGMHDPVPINIVGVWDPDGDDFTIETNRVDQNQRTEGRGNGSGNTCPDSDSVRDAQGNLLPWVRLERNGNEYPGCRRYEITFHAVDEGGSACDPFVVSTHVTHNASTTYCVDGGPLVPSWECPCRWCRFQELGSCPMYCPQGPR